MSTSSGYALISMKPAAWKWATDKLRTQGATAHVFKCIQRVGMVEAGLYVLGRGKLSSSEQNSTALRNYKGWCDNFDEEFHGYFHSAITGASLEKKYFNLKKKSSTADVDAQFVMNAFKKVKTFYTNDFLPAWWKNIKKQNLSVRDKLPSGFNIADTLTAVLFDIYKEKLKRDNVASKVKAENMDDITTPAKKSKKRKRELNMDTTPIKKAATTPAAAAAATTPAAAAATTPATTPAAAAVTPVAAATTPAGGATPAAAAVAPVAAAATPAGEAAPEAVAVTPAGEAALAPAAAPEAAAAASSADPSPISVLAVDTLADDTGESDSDSDVELALDANFFPFEFLACCFFGAAAEDQESIHWSCDLGGSAKSRKGPGDTISAVTPMRSGLTPGSTSRRGQGIHVQ